MKHTLLARYIFGFALMALALVARAQLAIEISGAGANRIPVAVAAFEGENSLPGTITEVVRGDLARSGLFSVVELGSQPMSVTALPDFMDVRGRGADAVLVGSVVPRTADALRSVFRLFDTQRQTELGALALRMTAQQHRATGHRIADFVFEKLTGLKGVFSTRIAYVVKSAGRFQLQIADADGMNAQTALASREPIISPAWSPDGSKLAYVSFEPKARRLCAFIGHRAAQRCRQFQGSNSAPAWSPDGRLLAVVLTRTARASSTVNADGSGVRRIASSSGIDTEPAWSADGNWIYFTSGPWRKPADLSHSRLGGGVERISFDGSYNVTRAPRRTAARSPS